MIILNPYISIWMVARIVAQVIGYDTVLYSIITVACSRKLSQFVLTLSETFRKQVGKLASWQECVALYMYLSEKP